MSFSIPAIEGLTIGNIISKPLISVLREIKSEEQNMSNAIADLNDLITLKRNLTILNLELCGLGISSTVISNPDNNESGTNLIKDKIKEIEQKIIEATNNFAEVQLTSQSKICELKKNLREQEYQSANIADLSNTKIISKPLHYNSLKMDGRYFSGRANSDYNKIKDFIRKSVNDFSTETSVDKLADTVIDKLKAHEDMFATEGTIIISATCTHLHASICDPLKINTNKAITAWNSLYPEDKIDKEKIVNQNLFENEEDKGLEVIIGANYGSSFVGMIHILKNDGLAVNLADLKANIDITNLDKLLKSKKISSHINLIVNGSIPKLMENNDQITFNTDNLIKAFNSFIENSKESKNSGIPISLYTTKVPIHEIVIQSIKEQLEAQEKSQD